MWHARHDALTGPCCAAASFLAARRQSLRHQKPLKGRPAERNLPNEVPGSMGAHWLYLNIGGFYASA